MLRRKINPIADIESNDLIYKVVACMLYTVIDLFIPKEMPEQIQILEMLQYHTKQTIFE